MKYELSRPIKLIQGDTITSLDLNFDNLNLQDIKTAQKVKTFFTDNTMLGTINNENLSPRLDANLRIGLSWTAALKSDARITINDVLSLSAKDALILSEEALTYFF